MRRGHEPESGPGLTILVIEEQVVTAQLITAVLRRAGYQVDYARDGFAAAEQLPSSAPALVVLDINMSRPNGIEFLRSIHTQKTRDGFRVLGVIMPGEAELAARAYQVGVDAFLYEPFDPEALLALVGELTAGARA